MRARNAAACTCLALALSLGVVSCGGDDDGGTASGGESGTTSLTIYSSLPLQGESRPQAQAVVNGIKLALQEAQGKVGRFTIKYQSLDDARSDTGQWEPGQVAANAREAAQDKSTIAYIGELNSGASAVSIPVLNQAGVLQVSPASTYVGLTDSENADKGEPDKYYPSGKRTFGRVVPADDVQATAQVAYQRDAGCTGVYVLHDKEVYGQGLADLVEQNAARENLRIVANEGIDTDSDDFRELAGQIRRSGADCMFFGGITANKAVQLFDDVHAANRRMKLFGADGVSGSSFTGELTQGAAAMTYITTPTQDPQRPAPAARKFFSAYEREFGRPPEPYAIYGYEAAKAAMLAIQNAGENGDDRQAVIDAFFQIKNRESPLGEYSIESNGDTTLTTYGGNRIEEGSLAFDQVIEPES